MKRLAVAVCLLLAFFAGFEAGRVHQTRIEAARFEQELERREASENEQLRLEFESPSHLETPLL